MASDGWSARLYWQWILYNTIAFVAVLTAVAVLSWIGADLLRLSFTNRSWLVALLVATAGALLFGGVLGTLYRRRTLGSGEPPRVHRRLGCLSRTGLLGSSSRRNAASNSAGGT